MSSALLLFDVILVNECYQLLCPTCVTPSVRHEIHAPVKNQPSVTKLKSLHQEQEICHETQSSKRGRAPVTKLKRGRAPVTKLKGGRGPVTKLKGGSTESGVQGLRPHRIHPLCVRARARAGNHLRPQSIVPERPSICRCLDFWQTLEQDLAQWPRFTDLPEVLRGVALRRW